MSAKHPKYDELTDLYERIQTKEVKEDKFYFDELDRILDDLFEIAVNKGMSWRDLASQSGLCYQTVINLGERWTRRPQYRTVAMIACVLGYQIEVAEVKGKARASLKIAG